MPKQSHVYLPRVSGGFFAVGAAVLAVCVFALLPAMRAVAQPTGELELREGFMDPQSGVTVEKITTLPGQEFQEIYLSVPKANGELEEVIVTAPRLENKTIEQKKTYTFVRDFDHNHYGLILYLGKEVRLPIRLYLDAVQIQPGDIEMP